MHRTATLIFLGCLVGCTNPTSSVRPDAYYSDVSQLKAGESSLFAGDAAVLSDEAIGKILQYRYSAPKVSRVAILPFGWSNWSGWSEEMALSTEQVNARVLATLKKSSRVYDAAFLPSILVPEKRTVPYLREAAARFQADLLVVFRSACQSFEKYRMFGSDETKAYCSVEAVLLDTRTGLVPFVAASLQNFSTTQAEKDINFREAILRAQLNALASALGDVSERTVNFLESDSVSPTPDGT
ncbi:MAG TPA: hypothetical protein VIH25_14185 [Steroidobacteraceae bacterium]